MNYPKDDRKEEVIQIHLIRWFRFKYRGIRHTISPIRISRLDRNKARILRKMLDMGYEDGTPDIMIFAKRGGYGGLFIELKNCKGKVSPDQCEYLADLNKEGYKALTCWSGSEAKDVIDDYMKLGKE